MRLGLEKAQHIVERIMTLANESSDAPIAVAVVGPDGQLIAFSGEDGVMHISRKLAVDKAYTAVMGTRDTIEWEEEAGLDGRNFCDPHFTCFGGGVVVKIGNTVICGIGVSGRHSSRRKMPPGSPLQDHELACEGRVWFEQMVRRDFKADDEEVHPK